MAVDEAENEGYHQPGGSALRRTKAYLAARAAGLVLPDQLLPLPTKVRIIYNYTRLYHTLTTTFLRPY